MERRVAANIGLFLHRKGYIPHYQNARVRLPPDKRTLKQKRILRLHTHNNLFHSILLTAY